MATGASDRRMSVSDVLNQVKHVHNGTIQPMLFVVGGRYVSAPTAGTSGNAIRWWLDPRGYDTPHREAVVLDSQTTLSTNATSTVTTGLGAFRDADVMVNLSAIAGTLPSLDMYFDTRLDGTNWVNIGRLTQATGTAAIVTAVHMSKAQSAGETIVTADAGAGTVRSIGWADDMRVRAVVGGTSPSVTYVVTGNFR